MMMKVPGAVVAREVSLIGVPEESIIPWEEYAAAWESGREVECPSCGAHASIEAFANTKRLTDEYFQAGDETTKNLRDDPTVLKALLRYVGLCCTKCGHLSSGRLPGPKCVVLPGEALAASSLFDEDLYRVSRFLGVSEEDLPETDPDGKVRLSSQVVWVFDFKE